MLDPKTYSSLLAALGLSPDADPVTSGTLSPRDFYEALQSDTMATVVDVRTPSEYQEGHLRGASLIDVLDQSNFTKEVQTLDTKRHYYIYCRSGHRSQNAALIMREMGLTVVELRGGVVAWHLSGMPLVSD